ncbi:siderophore ABC transporter substrate-binding protein [Bacillus taeanensis]|uniref:ABC transporter n=1 Tax=Bacillus taeanensis TaxID=273032 RepID=A0A366XXB9_9BACI|nr:siderophore ABC transporter substrate-binding protein [Bacillus taeanensis]RBW68783.1 ABC transporter [Bacillus taeanensis]
MKKNVVSFLLMAVLLLVLAACGGAAETTTEVEAEANGEAQQAEAAEITLTHELGETVITKNPETVVVFDFGALETLDQLGVEAAGVPKASALPGYLSKYEDTKYENVGSLKEPDFEKINSMDPDLIVISGRQAEAYEELSKIAPTLYISLDYENYMESFTENVNTLAEIFEKEEQAGEELASINASISALNEAAASSDQTGLIVLSNGGKVSAYGSGSRFGVIHDVFGVKPADENIEASTHGMSVSFEYIAEKNPDYLFVIDRDQVVNGEAKASEVFNNELVNGTNAAKNGKVIYLDPSVWYLSGGGLISAVEMAKEIETAIQ